MAHTRHSMRYSPCPRSACASYHFGDLRRAAECGALVFIVLLLFAGCDLPFASANTSTTPSPTVTPSPTATARPTATLGPSTGIPPLPARNVNGRAGDLQVQMDEVSCSWYTLSYGYYANVVVAGPSRSTYGAGDLQAIRNYLPHFWRIDNFVNAATATGGVLADAAGGPTCATNVTLTNTGKSTLIFPQVALQLVQQPRVNAYHYVLFNSCPFEQLKSQLDCPTDIGSQAGPCAFYSATFTLDGSGVSGSSFDEQLRPNDPSCPAALTINPGGTALVKLTFKSPGSYIYQVQLALEQDIGGGHLLVYTLDPARTALVFAQTSLFSCVDISSGKPRAVQLKLVPGTFCI